MCEYEQWLSVLRVCEVKRKNKKKIRNRKWKGELNYIKNVNRNLRNSNDILEEVESAN